METQYGINFAAKATGLNPHTIRSWELRYGAFEPNRCANGRRQFTLDHVKRISILRDATECGMAISKAAQLSDKELEEVVKFYNEKNKDRKDRIVKKPTGMDRDEVNVALSRALMAHNIGNPDILAHEAEKVLEGLPTKRFIIEFFTPFIEQAKVKYV